MQRFKFLSRTKRQAAGSDQLPKQQSDQPIVDNDLKTTSSALTTSSNSSDSERSSEGKSSEEPVLNSAVPEQEEEEIKLEEFIGRTPPPPPIRLSRTTGEAPISQSQDYKEEPFCKLVFVGAHDESDEKKPRLEVKRPQANSGVRLKVELPSKQDKRDAVKYNQPILIKKDNKYYIYGCLGDQWILSLLPEDLSIDEKRTLDEIFSYYSTEPHIVRNEIINDFLRKTLKRGHYLDAATPATGTGSGKSLLLNRLRENCNLRLMIAMPSNKDKQAAKRKEEPILIKHEGQLFIYGLLGDTWTLSVLTPDDLSKLEFQNIERLFSSYTSEMCTVKNTEMNDLLRDTLKRGHCLGHSTQSTTKPESTIKRYSNTEEKFSEQPFLRLTLTEIPGQKQYRTAEGANRFYEDADAIVFVVDCTVPLQKQIASFQEQLTYIRSSKKPRIVAPFLVINKIDEDSKRKIGPNEIAYLRSYLKDTVYGTDIPEDQVVEVSALTGENISKLDQLIQRKLFEAFNKRHSLETDPEPLDTADVQGDEKKGEEKKDGENVDVREHYIRTIRQTFVYCQKRLEDKDGAQRAVFAEAATADNGRKFASFLPFARDAIISAYESGKIEDVGAANLANEIETLVPFIANRSITLTQIKKFYSHTDVQEAILKSSTCGQAISELTASALCIALKQLEPDQINEACVDQINCYFGQFVAQLPKDSPVFQDETTRASGQQYAKYLESTRKRIVNDLRSKRITPDEAIELTFATGRLTPYVADRSVTIQDVEACFNNLIIKDIISRVPMYKRVIGGVIGAILGVCIGVTVGAILGAWSGPGAAFSALALGAYGATLGASIGAGAGLLISGPLGAYLTKRYSIWNYPLASMKKEAMKVAKQNEEKPSRKSPTPKARQDDSSQ